VELEDDLPNPVRLGRLTKSQDQYIYYELPNGKLVPIPPRYELGTKYEIKKLRNFEVVITKKVCACLECRTGKFQKCLHRDDIGAPVVGKVCGREYYGWPPPE